MLILFHKFLLESRLEKLYKELNDHVRYYKIAKDAGNEWQMQDSKKKILMLAAEIKREKAKSPEELDKDAFLRHHYTGHIPSSAYQNYEKEEGVAWLGLKEKYPVLLHKGKYGGHEIEFRQTGNKNRYTKTDSKGDIVRDERGNALDMTDDEIKAANLPKYDESIVAFDGDKPIGWASNEFGAVGVWVVKNYQKLGIGTDLLDMHIQLRPRMASGKGKIGQATEAGIALMAAYHRKMTKKHGPGWFRKLKGTDDD
jgi:GNAT superfamily N-acetyltransferase